MITIGKRRYAGIVSRFVLAFLVAASATAFAAGSYPDRPVRLVVPYPPGGGNDVIARMLAPELAKTVGTQIVIDNRPGAGGTIGSNFVARAEPDGYTLLIINTLPHTAAAGLYKELPYDPVKDFEAIGMIGTVPYMLAVNSSVPAKTVGQFIALARAKPGAITYESAGIGSATHLAGEFFKSATGVNLLHVPYKGGGPGLSDLLSGHVQATFENVAVLTPYVQHGTLRGLVITSSKRSPLFPDLPTMAESGYPGFEVAGHFGLVAPRGTPAPVIAQLSQALDKALADPKLVKLLATQGVEAQPDTSAAFAALIQAESAKWLKVIKDAQIKAQ
ncbi:tripartite tricarboxylate transporter substrate binding protein [Burkholderia sp. WAC0059]|uniref:tripartite tricarboxylate transporter substrate binding protein n=1 Tax=Burkholderia sp. WAC0059 TaxID=2066022 RepID=UPI0015E12DB1|nr:tripartite tricarboxylate transporter substrate binding protein [Burkholderia sp. WAC0059]